MLSFRPSTRSGQRTAFLHSTVKLQTISPRNKTYMPQQVEIDYLDGEFTIQETEPSTIQECVDLIGEVGVVDETTSNLRYRNKYPRVYKKVSAAIAAKFPRPQKTKEGPDGTKVPVVSKKKDGTETPVLVEPNEHLRQYLASGDGARAELQELFASTANAEPLYVKGERVGGGGKISQGALDGANSKFAAGEEAVEAAIETIEANIPGYKVARDAEGAATPESLARGIQALNKHLQQKALASAKALLS